jgi:hypothetical protein
MVPQRRLHREVKVIAHQAPGMHLPCGAQAGFGQSRNEKLTIAVAEHDVFAAISPIHEVINCSRIFDSRLSWHAQISYFNPVRVSIARTDPFPP